MNYEDEYTIEDMTYDTMLSKIRTLNFEISKLKLYHSGLMSSLECLLARVLDHRATSPRLRDQILLYLCPFLLVF